MRQSLYISIVLFSAACGLHAADLTPPLSPEKQALADFNKGVASPDVAVRTAAINTFETTKPPPSTWPLFIRVASIDPTPEVRHAAFVALAKIPARSPQLAKLLVSYYESLKPNDMKERIFIAKAMAPSEFKYDITAALVDQLERMRWAVEPVPYNGMRVSDKTKELVKDKQDEMEDFVKILNDFAKAGLPEAGKETNIKVKKWWDMNEQKFLKADMELTAKYAKEDADAAKAAKEAALAAKK